MTPLRYPRVRSSGSVSSRRPGRSPPKNQRDEQPNNVRGRDDTSGGGAQPQNFECLGRWRHPSILYIGSQGHADLEVGLPPLGLTKQGGVPTLPRGLPPRQWVCITWGLLGHVGVFPWASQGCNPLWNIKKLIIFCDASRHFQDTHETIQNIFGVHYLILLCLLVL